MFLRHMLTGSQDLYCFVFETKVILVMEEMTPNIPKISEVWKNPG